MAYFETAEELFLGVKDPKTGKREQSALQKCAKVRQLQYEVTWRLANNVPLNDLPTAQRNYFAKRFIGKKLSASSSEEISKAAEKLGYAVDATIKRCTKLFDELNASLPSYAKFVKPEHYESLLNWLTFNVIAEIECGVEIKVFSNEKLTQSRAIMSKAIKNRIVITSYDLDATIRKPHE